MEFTFYGETFKGKVIQNGSYQESEFAKLEKIEIIGMKDILSLKSASLKIKKAEKDEYEEKGKVKIIKIEQLNKVVIKWPKLSLIDYEWEIALNFKKD